MNSNNSSRQNKKGVLWRLIKTLFKFYPIMLPISVVLIILNAVVTCIPAVFLQNVIRVIEDCLDNGNWGSVGPEIMSIVLVLLILYIISLISCIVFNQLISVITQGSLKKMRCKMFDKMQKLPISYFDTNNHGDIMSHYTNDIDTLRQMISQSFPELLMSCVMVTTLFGIMVYYCIWLTIAVLAGVIIMLLITGRVGRKSSKYFVKHQEDLGKAEGILEEVVNGQKVVKVFCHEDECKADFDVANEKVFKQAEKANKYANTLSPILNNIGNILYVVVAIISGAFLLLEVPNFSLSGMVMSVSIVVPFLNMTRQFAGNVNQVSQETNAVVMGLAGAGRIFDLLDQQSEVDDGYVQLVNARKEK